MPAAPRAGRRAARACILSGMADESDEATAAKRKAAKRSWSILAALVVLVVVGGIGYNATKSPTPSMEQQFKDALDKDISSAPVEVVYLVDGTASSASLTVETPTGTSQTDASLPLTNKSGTAGLRFTGFSSGDFVYVSAQNDGDGTVVCHIRVDGVEISANSASGEYQIATCKGTV